MLKSLQWIALGVLLLTTVSPAFAQRPGGGFGFGGMMGRGSSSPYFLLSNSAVTEELALSEEQKEKAGELVSGMGEAMRGNMDRSQFEGLRDLSEEERRERFATMAKERQARSEKVLAEYKPKFEALLDEVQLQRLQEIQWQSQGTRALSDPAMVKALELTQEQQDKIAAITSEGFGPGFGGRRGGRGDQPREADQQDREARMQAFREQMEKRDAELKAVLTDAQKKEYSELLGAEFDVSKLRGGFGGRDGRRGRGGDRDGERDGERGNRDSNNRSRPQRDGNDN